MRVELLFVLLLLKTKTLNKIQFLWLLTGFCCRKSLIFYGLLLLVTLAIDWLLKRALIDICVTNEQRIYILRNNVNPKCLGILTKTTNQPSILRMRHLIQSYSDVIYDITDDVDDGSNNPKY